VLKRTVLLATIGVVATAALVTAAQPAQATFPGANGKIAFSTDLGPDSQIFTVNPDGSSETQLTHDDHGHAAAPDFSPDGTRIVFQGDESGPMQIYVMDADGSDRQLMFDDPEAFDVLPQFSPDGTRVAFTRCTFSGCTIDVVGTDGTGLTQLTSSSWNAFNASWSPNGTRIAFDSNQDGLLSAIWVMDANGGGQHRLTAPELEGFDPDWSPDGTSITFGDLCCQFGTNVWSMTADGSGLKQLTHFPTKHQGAFATHSPDGHSIVFVADTKYRDNCCNDLYTMDANGTHVTRIVTDQPGVFLSDWGPATP
jgi:Tol biopolymer transport system component